MIFTVPPGENITLPTDGTHCLTIDTINDNVLEGNHSFYVRVSSISNDAVTNSSNSSIEVVITDNERMLHYYHVLYYYCILRILHLHNFIIACI